jgi:hypothetical protein
LRVLVFLAFYAFGGVLANDVPRTIPRQVCEPAEFPAFLLFLFAGFRGY